MQFVPDLLARIADLYPAAPAMRDLLTGARVDYRTFDARASRGAGVLAGLGVGAGDRVGILCRNRIEFFEALFAVARIGAIGVPLNWRMPAAELGGILAAATPRIVLAGAEDEAKLPGDVRVVGFDDAGPAGWRKRLEAQDFTTAARDWPTGDIWYLLYTSGTTGAPKAVIQTYGMAVANHLAARQAIRLVRRQRTLNFLPLFHTAGINLFTLPFFFEGGEVAILPGFDVERVMALLEEGLDAFFGVPAVYQELSLHPRFGATDLSRVGSWACGGAPLPDALVRRFAAQGANVCNGYGMTESGPTTFLVDPEHATRKIGSVGRPRLMTRARIIVADGAPAPAGVAGEMQLKGPGVTPGYWNAPEATRAAFTEDGWLKTGDLARFDEDGFAYIVGRSKEMYISGGENV
ncbi:MAG: AMP-binding protein, partial [Parvularculaceae bacterium]|nr:AMP-binding protein [Parvularculaceae bacterium]